MYFQVDKFPGRPAMIDDRDVTVTYDDLLDLCKQVRDYIPERALVFCLCRTEIGSLSGYVAFTNNEILPLLLNANTDSSLIRALIGTYHPSYIWLPQDLEADFPYKKLFGRFGYSLLKTGLRPYLLHKDIGLLLSTSGSTGSPKLAKLSYHNLYGFMEVMENYLLPEGDTRAITTMPMDHNYGLLVAARMLYYGETALLTTKSMLSPEYWAFFKRQRATTLGGVPFIYEMLEKVKFTEMDLPGLRTMTEGGGSLPPRLHEKYARFCHDRGIEFVIIYGATEAPGGLITLTGGDTLTKQGSIGRPVPPGHCWLEDEDGNVVTAPGVPGEIVYEGPIVTMGYALCGEDLDTGDALGGVLHTGDMATVDEDGYYYIVGRKSRFLKMLGERVSLDEVEKLLSQHFVGAELACTGKDDKLYVFLAGGDASLDDQIRLYLVQTAKLSPTLIRIGHIEAMPRLGTGKPDYTALGKLV